MATLAQVVRNKNTPLTTLFRPSGTNRPAKSPFGCGHPTTPRLRLIASPDVRLTITATVGRSPALVQLSGIVLALFVEIVGDLAGMRFLGVSRVVFAGHVDALAVSEQTRFTATHATVQEAVPRRNRPMPWLRAGV